MTPSIKLTKNIIQDDPRNLVCYVTLSVLSAIEIPGNIFVVKYIPPTSPSDPGSKSFYNVAYVDQLSDLPAKPENKNKPCFLLTNTVTKSFANRQIANNWCTEIYAEIQRLLSTYVVQGLEGTYTQVTITENTCKEDVIVDMEDIMVDTTPIESSGSSESGEDTNPDEAEQETLEPIDNDSTNENTDIIDLTYDGKEVSL